MTRAGHALVVARAVYRDQLVAGGRLLTEEGAPTVLAAVTARGGLALLGDSAWIGESICMTWSPDLPRQPASRAT
jgi:hypothetical protein